MSLWWRLKLWWGARYTPDPYCLECGQVGTLWYRVCEDCRGL